ncbi:type II 3-dehydroquinate dehydratase [Cytobacillus kochii]|uniref:type II 3-dehydroquinate dehydratase n=1 Tax=Cytobacillus kochii TaxID=859143 RepID=UPI001CD311F4|nr:type II 3-dehydroquinate dehydratase [Cytobacillus kochii]MCA1028619.1 type II 3-dehydroquinate dehydratase [Cytobacillus kochii]
MIQYVIINGPNLNLLGDREPGVYGNKTLKEIEKIINFHFQAECKIDFYQSNHEGEIIDFLHMTSNVYNGIVFNPGAFMSYSYAIRDAIASISIPVIEVHMSNIFNRDSFRQQSVIAPVTKGFISGLGERSYILGIESLLLQNKLGSKVE